MKIKRYMLGTHAQNLLLLSLPLIILKLLTLIAFIVPLSGGELLKHEAMILVLLDAIGRGLAFMSIGVLILDYMEKKDNHHS